MGLQLPGNGQKYVERVDRMLDAMGGVSAGTEMARFLKFESTPGASPLLTDSNGNVGPDHRDHSKQVLARATLLLRLATGTVSDLLKRSGMDFEGGIEVLVEWRLRSSATMERRRPTRLLRGSVD